MRHERCEARGARHSVQASYQVTRDAVRYVVRPRDQIHFNQVFTDSGIGSVSVQGEVRFGGNYPITRGEHLSDLLMRVGGLTTTAYPAGTVFLRKSAAQVEEQGYKRAADEIQTQLLAGIARIGGDKITGEGYTAIQGFITQLRTQKGLGRIAISADPSVLAANPQQDPLLEAGDVRNALQAADSAFETGPRDGATADTIGVVYGAAGQHEHACKAFEMAVALAPDNAAFWNNLANSRLFFGRAADAERAYLRVIALEPGRKGRKHGSSRRQQWL